MSDPRHFTGLAGTAPESVAPPLSLKLDGILSQANDALGLAATIHGRTFGYPPQPAEASTKLQAVRVNSVETTVYDLREVVEGLHNALVEINNRI